MEKAGSYVSGASSTPLIGMTIGESLDRARELWDDHEALVSPSHGVRLTWRQLVDQVDAVAAGFLALGLERGDRIGVWSLNRPEWTLTQFAAAKAGLILVTINPAYRLHELEYALAKVGCSALVTATEFKTSKYMEMVNTLIPELASAAPGCTSGRPWSVPSPARRRSRCSGCCDGSASRPSASRWCRW